jgi:hypothetical protein
VWRARLVERNVQADVRLSNDADQSGQRMDIGQEIGPKNLLAEGLRRSLLIIHPAQDCLTRGVLWKSEGIHVRSAHNGGIAV